MTGCRRDGTGECRSLAELLVAAPYARDEPGPHVDLSAQRLLGRFDPVDATETSTFRAHVTPLMGESRRRASPSFIYARWQPGMFIPSQDRPKLNDQEVQ